jgi:ABC-type branched-subunit amino acid transport system substrate-binding protein
VKTWKPPSHTSPEALPSPLEILNDYTNITIGTPPTFESQKLMNRIALMTGSAPNEYSLLTYDALMVAARTMEKAGKDATLSELRDTLVSTFTNYSGITGDIILNNAGDRSNGSYFFWRVVPDGDTYKWEHVITYTDGTITDVN